MDFTSAYLTPKIGHSAAPAYVQDCIVVLEWLEDGRRQRLNLHFLCDCPDSNKNDYHFVLHACLRLFAAHHLDARFDVLNLWTDGGPHHFKTRYCQWMWHWLSTQRFSGKPILHHFFASYHGHSLADAQAAVMKRALHSQYNVSQLQRLSPTVSALYWGPANASDLAALIAHACPNTQCCVFPHIDRDPLLKPRVSHIEAIKSKHCFVYANGKCAAASDSACAVSTAFSFTLKP